MISTKLLDQTTKADIDQLVADGTAERRTIEYKQQLPGMGDADRKEFVADVSSIANAQGGDLVYGISATDGIPTEARGLADFNFDAVKLRLESLMRDGLDPRLHGVQFHAIDGFADGPVLILRVPRSWTGPHRVKLGGSSRFFSRGNAGKFEMDTSDIRSAVESSGDLPRRIRDWRDERLGRIIANDGPMALSSGSALVLHIVPLDALAYQWRFEPTELRERNLSPLDTLSWNSRLNIDGCVTYEANSEKQSASRAYTQFFRSGALETVRADLVERDRYGNSYVPDYEPGLVKVVKNYLANLQAIGVLPPVVLFLTLVGVKDAYLFTREHPEYGPQVADRNMIVAPDLLVEQLEGFDPNSLRPAFDALRNAFGYNRSPNFDGNGNWAPRR